MHMVFLRILNMSISASWLVLAVWILRLMLKKSPRWVHVALWALVAVRLICPVSIQSQVSLIPSAQTVPDTILYDQTPSIHSGVELIDKTVNTSLEQNKKPAPGDSVNPVQIDLFIWENLWCLGVVIMLTWAGVSYLRLQRKVAASVDVGERVYLCDYIGTPFILGIFRPRIYLPSSMEPDDTPYVLAHERAHIARCDHWWKPFGYVLLAVYWFNPLLWLAYILLCRDIELACDEKVIRDMELSQKKAYSEALLHCSVRRMHIAACPLAFGEVGVKERVKTVLNYRKPAFWIVMVAILALVVTAVCFLTDPKTEEPLQPEAVRENPYIWTSTVAFEDIQKAWAYPNGQAAYANTVENSKLEELIQLVNGVKEREISPWEPSGKDDPLWNTATTHLYLFCDDGNTIFFLFADSVLHMAIVPESEGVAVDGYWRIENAELIQWMQNIGNGGTYMLSDENRDEVRQLLRQENVQFFNPQEYGDLLFVGCAYDHGRGRAVACYESRTDGCHLLKLIRDGDVKRCASGSELYYCDYQDLRIFLILNESVTALEWAGAYENTVTFDTHPGLAVAYFPETLDAMYRFRYSGGTTLYMDRENQSHVSPPVYVSDALAEPDDAYRVCSNLKLSDVNYVFATQLVETDYEYVQAHSWDFSQAQVVELLNLLHQLPGENFETAQYPDTETKTIDIFLGEDPENPLGYPYMSLILNEGEVYYRFAIDAETTCQAWKIQSPRLLNFLESFFTGDLTGWMQFAPMPKREGEIRCSFGNIEIVIPKLAAFTYELTEDGIRFKPKGETDWVLLQYRTEPYVPEELGLRRFREVFGNREVVRGCYGDPDQWNFIDFAVTSGDMAWNILLLNENASTWVVAYHEAIGTILYELSIHLKD